MYLNYSFFKSTVLETQTNYLYNYKCIYNNLTIVPMLDPRKVVDLNNVAEYQDVFIWKMDEKSDE